MSSLLKIVVGAIWSSVKFVGILIVILLLVLAMLLVFYVPSWLLTLAITVFGTEAQQSRRRAYLRAADDGYLDPNDYEYQHSFRWDW